jgi:hypothetical protein
MKRFSLVLVLIVALFLIGCATDGQVPVTDQASKELIAKISGRRIGAELQKNYPDVAVEVQTLCCEITASNGANIVDIAVRRLIKVLADETGDKLLAADIKDLLELLKVVPDIEIAPDQLAIIIAAAKGLISGIELQGGV